MVRALLAGLSVTLLAGCAGIVAGAHFQPETKFAEFRTFAWAPRDELPTGDPRLDNNPFFDAQVRSAVEAELGIRGMRPSPDQADLEVHYHASVERVLNVYTVDRVSGYDSPGGVRDTALYAYDEGTLVVDLVDAHTNQVVWRGWARASLEGVIDDTRRMRNRVEESVQKMFERYPLRP